MESLPRLSVAKAGAHFLPSLPSEALAKEGQVPSFMAFMLCAVSFQILELSWDYILLKTKIIQGAVFISEIHLYGSSFCPSGL
jgi:hypothetical protein